MKNRKKVEDFILKYVDKIAPGSNNKQLYKDMFKEMSDKEFKVFMDNLKKKKLTLSIIEPNTKKSTISVENNYKIAKELGFSFFQRLTIRGKPGIPDYTTPNKYLIMALPVRRASQLLTKKISIPSDDKSIDLTTGTVTGKSRGSKLTMPEIQILAGMGLNKSIKELMKYRGGDLGAKNAMSALLMKQGSVSQDVLDRYSTGVVSSKTLSSYWNAVHIKNNVANYN